MKKVLEIALPQIARRFENELVLVAPVDTGRLRNSIRVTKIEKGLLIVMVNYAIYVEYGTPPHIIKPKLKKALKWGKGKNVVFAKEVKHPGSRPNPFIRNTIQNKLRKIIEEELIKAL